MDDYLIPLLFSIIALFSSVILVFNGCGSSKSTNVVNDTSKIKISNQFEKKEELEVIEEETSIDSASLSLSSSSSITIPVTPQQNIEELNQYEEEQELEDNVSYSATESRMAISQQAFKTPTLGSVEMKFKFKDWNTELQII